MKKMNYAEPFIDGYNAVVGTIVAVLSYILGEHWVLFVAFLLLNVADWLTGWMKSRIAGKENSMTGWKGVLKKLGYWLMVMVAFGASAVFIEIGHTIGIDLGIMLCWLAFHWRVRLRVAGPCILLAAAVSIGLGNALSRDVVHIDLVGSANAPARKTKDFGGGRPGAGTPGCPPRRKGRCLPPDGAPARAPGSPRRPRPQFPPTAGAP